MDDERRRTSGGRGRGSVPLGHLGGIAISVEWSLLVVFALVTWGLAVGILPELVPHASAAACWVAAGIAAVAFFASLLLHELAHSVVARHYGVGVQGIRLWLLGGVSTLASEPASPRDDFFIALAGPATSGALAVSFFTAAAVLDVLGVPDVVLASALWLGTVNGLLALFNLLPGAPLDGGRIVRAVAWHRHGDRERAALVADRAGKALGWVLIGAGGIELALGWIAGLWLALVGWFVISTAEAEAAQTVLTHDLGGVRAGDVMAPAPVVAPADISVQRLLDDYVFRYRHAAFPLVDADGTVRALATLDRCRQIAPAHRRETSAVSVSWPVEQVTIAAPGEPLLDVLRRCGDAAGGHVLVFRGNDLVGIISPADVARTIEIARAQHEPIQDAA